MRRLFRALMRLFPSDFRGDFGEEMQEVFAEELGEARGRARRAGVLGRTASSMARAGLALHLVQIGQDARYALRTLRHAPWSSAMAIAALSFGIGASVLTFSVADAFLFKPLPYADATRLVHIWGEERARDARELRVSLQEVEAWRGRSDLFAGVAAFNYTAVELLDGPEPEQVPAGLVSANVFDLLGVAPLLGRAFQPGDDALGAEPVALVGEEFWRTRMASRPDVLGAILEVGGTRHRVVGVMPAGVAFPLPVTRIWLPRTIDLARFTPDVQPFQAVARLRPDVSLAQADAALATPLPGLGTTYPVLDGRTAQVVPLREALNFAYDILTVGALVMGAASLLVLLTACVNISSLMLGRAIRRGREVALRAAIGASRFRLVRQFLVESLVLSAFGAVGGALLASWGVRLLTRVVPEDFHRAAPFAVDGRALLVAAALAAVAAAVFGLAPAIRFARVNLAEAMRQDGGGGTTSLWSLRLQSLLVQGQVMLSVVLLVATVLVARSFSALGAVDPGFEADGVLTIQVSLPSARYPDPEAVARFHEEVVRRAEAVPGVTVASTVNYLPLNHETQTAQFSVDGVADADRGRRPEAVVLSVGPGYFDVLRIPLLEGRVFDSSDRRGRAAVAVINRSMAERYWPGRSPVGATLLVGESDTLMTVVGVVADTRHDDLAAAPESQMYTVQAQRPWTYLRLLARSSGDVAAQAGPLSAAIRDVDARLPLGEIRTMREVVDEFLLPQRSLSVALLALGGFALWLALFGIYSIVSCFVADRTRELGVRVALGADESRIVRHVLRRGLVLAGGGAAVGLLLAAGASQALRGLLFGVGAADPLTYAVVAGLVVGVAALASLLPARRAARVSPLLAMKG